MASRPDRIFRIADRRHAIFDATGAFLYGGRWNSPGRRVIYAADSFAGAMLETLAHAAIGRVPRTHVWIEIPLPANVSIEFLQAGELPRWQAPDSKPARRFGDRWHDEHRSLILFVPSVVTSGMSQNVLINQDHPEFPKLQPSRPKPLKWDGRLF